MKNFINKSCENLALGAGIVFVALLCDLGVRSVYSVLGQAIIKLLSH